MLDVGGSRELQATILALRQMPRELRSRVTKATREKVTPDWNQELAANAETGLEVRVLARNARTRVGGDRVQLTAAQSVKKMRGGASPKDIGHAVEFGAQWRRGQVNATSSKGKAYKYDRTLNKQLRPRRSKGYVVYPAAARMASRYASLWVQLTVKTMYDAIERKL